MNESDPKQKQACNGVKAAATCNKWIAENDAELSTSVWLLCEPSPDLDFPIGTVFSAVTPRQSDNLAKRLLVSLLHNIHITHQS